MIIERRFRGPPDSGNGGYSCGRVAALLDGPCEVTLRSPPPLDTELSVERRGPGVAVLHRSTLVAEAVPFALSLEVPAAVTPAQAAEASKRYPWFHGHPYPSCFVCGPERAEGDGLRIWPGAVEGRNVAAAPWVVDPSLCENGSARPEIVWAALDCPSWYGMSCFQPFEGLILLGRLAARIHSLPRAGQRCVAMGWFLDRDGRKIRCGSAVHDESGNLLAAARATWIVLR